MVALTEDLFLEKQPNIPITMEGVRQGITKDTDELRRIHSVAPIVSGIIDLDEGLDTLRVYGEEAQSEDMTISSAQAQERSLLYTLDRKTAVHGDNAMMVDLENDKVIDNLFTQLLPLFETGDKYIGKDSEKIQLMARVIKMIGGGSTEEISHGLKGCKYLGQYFVEKGAICRHKALMFKILCDKVGLLSSIQKGFLLVNGDYCKHAWNNVFIDGKWFIIDIAQGKVEPFDYPNKEDSDKKKAGYYSYNKDTQEFEAF